MDRTVEERVIEHRKYANAYGAENYKMGKPRMQDAILDLTGITLRDSYLDVSCGRGEMLDIASGMDFERIQGTEIVPDLISTRDNVEYAEVHNLPFDDNSFQVVSMFDVIEHVLQGDDRLACKEMQRVATNHILLTANNKNSFNGKGDQLHINKREYEEWDSCFREWFGGCTVHWLKTRHYVSHGWRIDL